MKFHWKVLLWMLAGAVTGLVMRGFLPAPAWTGATWKAGEGGLVLVAADGDGPVAGLDLGAERTVVAAVVDRGRDRERRVPLAVPEDLERIVSGSAHGDVLWLELGSGEQRMLTLAMDPGSALATWIAPVDFLAEIFMALLRMLIVPIVFTSIVTGVAGVSHLRDLRRLGGKTLLYYLTTSLLAILVGQVLVVIFRPGDGAHLGLAGLEDGGRATTTFWGVLERMVPDNIFDSLGDNRQMLSIMFFALLFGFFVTRTPNPYRERAHGLFEALFQVVLEMAQGIMALLPYGVFCLIARVVAKTGLGVFEPLALYFVLVAAALVIHSVVTLPLILSLVGRMSPRRWFQAMAPALMTAFSTSSSSLTLPVTLETVEKRGRVSNRITSFTLPLGSTINMDGTALYECIGVMFLAQYYASTGAFELTLGVQAQVVIMALLASVGAAGIPSAGLVMMMTILAALHLPLEGAALLLAVDRPLDMLRTTVNIWSDSCGAAVIARSEGEQGPLEAGFAAGSGP